MTLNPVGPRFLADLAAGLGEAPQRDVPGRYLEEPRGLFKGRAGALVRPRDTGEVAHVVACCRDHRVGLLPYGGGTGLVGAQVSEADPPPLVVSLERMNRIRAIDAEDAVIEAEAGAVLANLQAAAEGAGLRLALSLAAQGSCQIGGNLATNAGGVGVLRYGNARNLCLGLEAVLGDGRVWNGLSRLRKDNTGYDLRDLLIGSEGTLGIITAATLKLVPRPETEVAAFACIPDPRAALVLLGAFRRGLGDLVQAFELVHVQGLRFLAENLPQIRQPFDDPGEWMVLVDLGGSAEARPRARLEAVLAAAFEAGHITDAVVSQNAAQRAAFWTLRETIPEANRMVGAVSSHDISVPISRIPDLVDRARAAIAAHGEDLRINCFGHIGDGNLHLNVYPPAGRDKADFAHLRAPLCEAVFEIVQALGGSFSAEHGIGRLKLAELERYGDPAKLAAMRAVKAALDPLGILNPGAVLARRGS